jgi:hypothetical protein
VVCVEGRTPVLTICRSWLTVLGRLLLFSRNPRSMSLSNISVEKDPTILFCFESSSPFQLKKKEYKKKNIRGFERRGGERRRE